MKTKGIVASSKQYFHDKVIVIIRNLAPDFNPKYQLHFHVSRAQREGYRQLYGRIYMEELEDEFFILFQIGSANLLKKRNPGKMREHLINMFPYAFSIPSELEINHKFINSKSQQQKQKSKSNNPNKTRG